jgi:hypothetical protein
MFEIWCSALSTLRQLSASDLDHGRRAQSHTPPNTLPDFYGQSTFRYEWQYIRTTFTTLDFETQFFMSLIKQSPMDINPLPMKDSFPIVGIHMMQRQPIS